MATEEILAKYWAAIDARRDLPDGPIPDFLNNPFKLRHKVILEAYEVLEASQARRGYIDTNAFPEGDEEGKPGFGTRHHVAAEATDLIFHLLVLLASVNMTPSDVYEVLERRYEKWMARAAAG